MIAGRDALEAAEKCFNRAATISLSTISNERALAQATYAQALAEAGKGYVSLAKELREGAGT